MVDDGKNSLLIEQYEKSLQREEDRRNTFEQKSSTLVGFLGATVGIYVGIVLPQLLSDEFLKYLSTNCNFMVLWCCAMLSFASGVFLFLFMIWTWNKMLSPSKYMYPSPTTLLQYNKMSEIQEELLNDLRVSIEHNQGIINNDGTLFIRLVNLVKFIMISFLVSVVFFVICKLTLI